MQENARGRPGIGHHHRRPAADGCCREFVPREGNVVRAARDGNGCVRECAMRDLNISRAVDDQRATGEVDAEDDSAACVCRNRESASDCSVGIRPDDGFTRSEGDAADQRKVNRAGHGNGRRAGGFKLGFECCAAAVAGSEVTVSVAALLVAPLAKLVAMQRHCVPFNAVAGVMMASVPVVTPL